ncbi:MAG: hypothetical protein HQL14_00290 [Candidatus Omnitrophica bacterium]|nr:hypothetical protein [Candidatus Omnitrophota bacterium]
MKDFVASILKIFGFLAALPLIFVSVLAFWHQILLLPAAKEGCLLWGAGIYVGLNLFVYDFKDVYAFGKTQIENLFTFFKPAGFLIPVYSVVLIIVYQILLALGHVSLQPVFLFAIAFGLAMHVVQTAREIYTADNSFLKAHYLCTFGVVLIVSLFFISLLLAWAVGEYSLVGFIKAICAQTGHFYKSIWKALFVDSSV